MALFQLWWLLESVNAFPLVSKSRGLWDTTPLTCLSSSLLKTCCRPGPSPFLLERQVVALLVDRTLPGGNCCGLVGPSEHYTKWHIPVEMWRLSTVYSLSLGPLETTKQKRTMVTSPGWLQSTSVTFTLDSCQKFNYLLWIIDSDFGLCDIGYVNCNKNRM